MNNTNEVEERYSRQHSLFTVSSLADASILLLGATPCGIEIAKNLGLSGVKSVSVWDCFPLQLTECSAMSYLTPESVGENRAIAFTKRMDELQKEGFLQGSFCTLVSTEPAWIYDAANLEKYQIVVADASVFGPSGLLDEHLHHFNDLCRQVSSKLIVYEIRGSAALIFEDLLDSYQFLEGTSNHVPKPVYCIDVDKSKQDTLNIWTDHTRNVNSASKIRFIKGEEIHIPGDGVRSLDVLSIPSGDKVSISCADGFVMSAEECSKGVYFEVVPDTKEASFEPLTRELAENWVTPYEDALLVLCAVRVLNRFYCTHARMPTPRDPQDICKFSLFVEEEIARPVYAEFQVELRSAVSSGLFTKFSDTCQAQLQPMAALVGGHVAHEVFKIVSGKYSPLTHQERFFSINLIAQLYRSGLTPEQCAPKGTRHDGQVIMFGVDLQQRLSNMRLVVAGVGAVGCECIKDMAAMGVCCGENGRMTLVDGDCVEISNLHRQLCFTEADAKNHTNKSDAAATYLTKAFNSSLRVQSQPIMLEYGTQTKVHELFEQSDAVICTVDGYKARDYVGDICQAYEKIMTQGGTGGMFGHSLVVVPKETAPYGQYDSGRIDPKKADAEVTCLPHFVKKRPGEIIRLACEKYEHIFNAMAGVMEVRANVQVQFGKELPQVSSSEDSFIVKLLNRCRVARQSTVTLTALAKELFFFLFQLEVLQDLKLYADKFVEIGKDIGIEGMSEEEKQRNIAALMKQPRVQEYDKDTIEHRHFITATTSLFEMVFKEDNVIPLPFQTYKENTVVLEWIALTSMIYGSCYSIPIQGDKSTLLHLVRRIAGNISPAIISTTAITSALMSLELYKVAMKLLGDQDVLFEDVRFDTNDGTIGGWPLSPPGAHRFHYFGELTASMTVNEFIASCESSLSVSLLNFSCGEPQTGVVSLIVRGTRISEYGLVFDNVKTNNIQVKSIERAASARTVYLL